MIFPHHHIAITKARSLRSVAAIGRPRRRASQPICARGHLTTLSCETVTVMSGTLLMSQETHSAEANVVC